LIPKVADKFVGIHAHRRGVDDPAEASQSITQEPEAIESLWIDSHQFTFTLDIVQEQQQHHAQDDFGRY
jgi:hypothetical protein